MAIFGIGTDIIEIARIKMDSDSFVQRFSKRLLTEQELQEFSDSKQPQRFLAKRWAAKEACAKALGTGIGEAFSFQDVSITHDPVGKPELTFSDTGKALLTKLGVASSFISIADEQHYAVANVVLERG